MTTWDETGKDKWYSVYVPSSGGTTANNEAYLRLGSPNVNAEAVFLNALKANYATSAAQPAVQAAFATNATGGLVVYTAGDLVQFINGKSDTRVLNDSYVVHVLNKADVDAANTASTTTSTSTTPATAPATYRSYLRLGKPHPEIETPLAAVIPDDQTVTYAKALAPTDTSGMTAASAQSDASLVLTGDTNAGTTLLTSATNGSLAAIDAIESLRTSTAAGSQQAYSGSTSVNAWALSTLQGLELKFANNLRDKALMGDASARSKLQTQATDGDPIVRQKLVDITTSTKVAASTSYNGLPTAIVWATGVLKSLPAGSEVTAQWSLGGGIAMFSDQPVSITTPATLKVTVGSDSRTVLGPTYTETYDVDDSTIENIRNGTITQVDQISQKKLITATLVKRSYPFWRTTKFDQSKSLTYSVTDSGTFSLSASYAFGVGLKLTNGVNASFDASVGVSGSVPVPFKVELNAAKTETSWGPGNKCDYKEAQDLRGRSLSLTTSLADTSLQSGFVAFTKIVRVSMAVVNGAVAAYTAAVIVSGNISTEDSTGPVPNIKEILDTGEYVYAGVTALNAIFLAASLIAGAIQITAKVAVDLLKTASPAQEPNVSINTAGVKLQSGASYIHIDDSGIIISGPQVFIAGAMTNILPTYLPSVITPTQLTDAVALGLNIAQLAAMFS